MALVLIGAPAACSTPAAPSASAPVVGVPVVVEGGTYFNITPALAKYPNVQIVRYSQL